MLPIISIAFSGMAFAGLEHATKPSLQALINALNEVCEIPEWASPPRNKMDMVGTIEECLSHIIEEKGADEVDAIQAEARIKELTDKLEDVSADIGSIGNSK